ncbi:MAG: hypothetical protein ACXAD7_09205 [Candidatus Kariarchaeaceae archaeon]
MEILTAKEAQVYCERCNVTSWFEISNDMSLLSSGLAKRSLIHNDHVLVCEIDSNGSVRNTQIIPIKFNPMDILIEDVAQGFHYINVETSQRVVIDCYTSNNLFRQFIQKVIITMFEQATSNRIEDKYRFSVTTHFSKTILHSDQLTISVGPYLKKEAKDEEDCTYRGIILDFEEAEKNQLDVETTLDNYDWAAVMVPKDKKEGYFHALSSYFLMMETPYYIDSLSNQSIKELFDFVIAILIEYESSTKLN